MNNEENYLNYLTINYKEIENQLITDYKNMIKLLNIKYGKVEGNYFLTESCKSKNQKITRTKEGLFVHHVYGYIENHLSYRNIAYKFPFEYQKANQLVYCDYLEHLILHLKIGEIKKEYHHDLSIGEMIKELILIYSGKIFKINYKINIANKIKDYSDQFLEILKKSDNKIINTICIWFVSNWKEICNLPNKKFINQLKTLLFKNIDNDEYLRYRIKKNKDLWNSL